MNKYFPNCPLISLMLLQLLYLWICRIAFEILVDTNTNTRDFKISPPFITKRVNSTLKYEESFRYIYLFYNIGPRKSDLLYISSIDSKIYKKVSVNSGGILKVSPLANLPRPIFLRAKFGLTILPPPMKVRDFYSFTSSRESKLLECRSGSAANAIGGKTKFVRIPLYIPFDMIESQDCLGFINLILNSPLLFNKKYSLLIKLKKGEKYLMLSNRQEFLVIDKNDRLTLEKLFNFICDRLTFIFEDYYFELNYELDVLILEFYHWTTLHKYSIRNIDILNSLDINTKDVKSKFNLFGGFERTGLYSNIYNTDNPGLNSLTYSLDGGKLTFNFNLFNLSDYFKDFDSVLFMSYFDRDKNTSLTLDNSKFYLIKYRGRFLVLSVSIISKLFIKQCFNCYGERISLVYDEITNENTLVRKSGNFSYIFDNKNNIISISKKFTLKSMTNPYKENWDYVHKSNFGTLDIETFDFDGISRVYAIGFYTEDNLQIFYLEKDMNFGKLIHLSFDHLLTKDKYKNTIFYVHNLGKFDSLYIIKNLTTYNQCLDTPYYFETVTRDSDVIKLVVKRVIKGKVRKVTLHDSLAMLPNSLADLCKSYDIELNKTKFPYDFVSCNTLYYSGVTPNISYYSGISLIEYQTLYKEDWDLKEETIKYLTNDLKSLYLVLEKVIRDLHKLFNLHMTDSLTISSLSMRLYLTQFYNKYNNKLPIITDPLIYTNIKSAYYGGRVEVFRPYGKNLYYYDVNSLYPYGSLNKMCGNKGEYVEFLNKDKNIKDLSLGFYYCKIDSNKANSYLGLLPRRSVNNFLTFPLGQWEDWYFSEELKFAQDNGYKIEVVKGYCFNEVEKCFDDFVHNIMKIKTNPINVVEKNLAKLILNSLPGRFGMDPFKYKTGILKNDELALVMSTNVVKSSYIINDNCHLVTYKDSIDKNICDLAGLDFIKVLNDKITPPPIEGGKNKSTVSITTSSAILSYSRIHMAKTMLYVIKKGGKLYYTDTDSLVTDIQLPSFLIDSSLLGKFKLEHKIIEGYFLADKTYAFISSKLDRNGKNIIVKKAKGVLSDRLTFEDYRNMYKEGEFYHATNVSSIKNFNEGSILIKTKEDVKLNLNYTKRKKVKKEGRWIDTSPLVVGVE